MRRFSARAAVAALIVMLLSSLGVVASPASADTTDVTPPAQVTNLGTTASYQSVNINLTLPTDADFSHLVYAVAPGSAVPSRPSFPWEYDSAFIASGLSMDTDYTLAVWSVDRSGNVSDPVTSIFKTLLDSDPPHPVTGLTFTGGAYQVTASWTPPTDADLQQLTGKLTDDATGTVSSFTMGKAAAGYTWRRPGGRSYTFEVTATDIHGLVSDVATATAQTDPDANGAPPPIPPSTVTFWPADSSVWMSFARPAIPDLAGLAYALVPLGQDPRNVTTFESLDITSPSIGRQIIVNAIFMVEGGQLVLRVTDLNGNSTLSTVPGLRAAQQYSRVPPAPTTVTVSSPADDVLDVGWTAPSSSDATSWTITAVSGPYYEVLTVPGQDRQARLTALAGQRNWTVGVSGRNDSGSGGGRTAEPVAVAGAEPPPPVSNAASTPDYDVQLLTWRNPASPDFDHVEITQLEDMTAESRVVYRGRASFARLRGLVPGHGYSFEIRSFDRLGRAGGVPITVRTFQATVTLSLGVVGATPPGAVIGVYGEVHGRGGYPAVHQPVSLESLPAGASVWRRVVTPGTTAWTYGTFQPTVQPLVTTRYRLAYRGSPRLGGGYSPVSTVIVRPPAGAAKLTPSRGHWWTAWLW